MAGRWELQEHYDRVVEFLDSRDLFNIPKEEVWDFIKMNEKRRTFPTQAAMRLATMYELHRMRNDYSYARSVEVRTLRNVWYQLIKPFLNRIERPRDILAAKWGRQRSQVLSAVLSEMVLSGMCRYKDFNVEDRTRPNARPWNKLKVGRFDEVVIFIEKDTQFTRLEGMADLLGFAVECGKGQQATTAIEGLIDYLEEGKSYLVFTVTDHDYYGHLIASSMAKRVQTLGIDAEFHRFGVNPDQVPKDRIDVAKFLIPMKSDRERDWALMNAIDGRYGLEIEALTAKELRKALSDAVYDYCEPEALYEYLKEKAIEDIMDDVVWDVVESMAGGVEEIQELLNEIRELREKVEELKKEIRDKVKPIAEEVVDDKVEELDDREDFPYEWLEEQIIEGKTSLYHEEYTDPSSMRDGLVQLVVEEMEALR